MKNLNSPRKILRYSYKRVTTYRPRNQGNSTRKRILFAKKFIEALENPDVETFIIDEVGWGRPLRAYGYSRIGEPLIIKYGKQLANITFSCCISRHGVEGIQCFSQGVSCVDSSSSFSSSLFVSSNFVSSTTCSTVCTSESLS